MDDFPEPLPLDPMPTPLPERTVEPEPVDALPPAPFEEGQLIDPITVLPELAATGAEWLLIAAVAFALLAVGFAFLAAASWSPRPRYRRGLERTRSGRGSAGFTP